MNYPAARRSTHTDRLHGVDVPDPYRWLEAADAPDTRAWVDAQNVLTRAYLDGPPRDALVTALATAFGHPRATMAMRRGDRYFYGFNPGLQPQATLFVQEGRYGAARVLIDPNTFSGDGTVALTAVEPSNDGSLVAYAISRGGSDRQEIRVRDVRTGRDLADTLIWVKFATLAWTPESTGFYYLRFPEPGTVPADDEQYFGRIYFHRLGDPQRADALVFERPEEKEVVPLVNVTPDGRFVVITAQRGASDDSEIYLLDTHESDGVPRPLFTGYDAAYSFISAMSGRLFFRTTKDAPLGRIISVDASGTIAEVIAESSDRLIAAVIAGGTLVTSYLHHASSELKWEGMPLTDVGTARGPMTVTSIDGEPEHQDIVFTMTSFTEPPGAFGYDPSDGGLWRLTSALSAGNTAPSTSDRFDTRQVWYTSKDGTRVSMFLVHRRDLRRDEVHPVLLSGYGGFNISRTPAFDPGLLPFLDRGGIFALANLRGGGEYGEAWHQAGMLERKQNVFDDFIAAAEYLIAERCTTPATLAIEGGSNGGLLVGAVMMQRPELFGAVICRVPVADMLRYHLFTVGRFWIPEYGSADDPDQFRFLLAYSPYHNVRPGVRYPPTLVMTADTDDRVSPGMAKKLAARLQAEGVGGPFLIRIETKAGHGAGKPVTKLIEEDADILRFLERTIG